MNMEIRIVKKSAGRPAKHGNQVRFTIMLPERLIAKIKAEADRINASYSAQTQRYIEAGMISL